MTYQEKREFLKRLMNMTNLRFPHVYAENFMHRSFFMYRFSWFRKLHTYWIYKQMVRGGYLIKHTENVWFGDDNFKPMESYQVSAKGSRMVLTPCTDNKCNHE